jgi:WXG100 family type VII secretion target
MATGSTGAGPASQFEVHAAGVITSLRNVDDVNTEIKTSFRQLKAEADAVIKGSWTGAAADKVHDGWQEWQDGLSKICAALDQVNGLVAQAAQRFQRTDETG